MVKKEIIDLLGKNSEDDFKEVIKLIKIIAENILKYPKNAKYRTLSKRNESVSKKLLPFHGAKELLLFLGFKEMEHNFFFSFDTPTKKLEIIKNIKNFNDFKMILSGFVKSPLQDNIKPINLPKLEHKFNNPFLRNIAECYHNALVYQNQDLIRNARGHIPVDLTQKAERRLRSVQKEMTLGKMKKFDVSIQEFILLELLRWFKEEYFTWVDSPSCSKCGGKTTFSHFAKEKELLVYTQRVEMHKCLTCAKLTPFPRYNDLNILLETRRGRCGEWANVFTLFCHVFRYDARIVFDIGDHVWTEVYSIAQQKWIHCDPCENAYDTPLMYEHGWNKNITYVMAYSPVDIQDVTWRYTSDHKKALKNRNLCKEEELVNAIITLRNERWQRFCPQKRENLTKRVTLELAYMMKERSPKDNELEGRISGSLDWRLSRREITGSEIVVPYSFIIKDENIKDKKCVFRYSCSLDQYSITHLMDDINVNKWNCGVLSQENIMRKHEKDWKMVYLCRKEGASNATISWKFLFETTLYKLNSLRLIFKNETFENGVVEVKICSEKTSNVLPKEGILVTNDFAGSSYISIIATLYGGKGDLDWQHAQLFRQPESSLDFPFKLIFFFD